MKFLTITIIITGIILLFNLAGITTPTGEILSTFIAGGFSAATVTGIWENVESVLGGLFLVGAVAGIFGRTPDISWALAGFAVLVGGATVTDMIGLFVKISPLVDGWMLAILTIVFVLVFYAFVFSLISWWRGSDG